MFDSYATTFQFCEPEETFLWMVDIVHFSRVTDESRQKTLIQNLFKCIYLSMAELTDFVGQDPVVRKELTSDDATVIWTGDGAIVAMKAPFSVTSPFVLSHMFTRYWQDSANWRDFRASRDAEIPKLHMAAHVGGCRWLKTPTLRSPIFEVSNCFGVPINVLARISNFSGPDGDYISSPELLSKLAQFKGDGEVPGDVAYSSMICVGKNSITDIRFGPDEAGQVSGKENNKYTYRRFAFTNGPN
jgi:hypothetical protein